MQTFILGEFSDRNTKRFVKGTIAYKEMVKRGSNFNI